MLKWLVKNKISFLYYKLLFIMLCKLAVGKVIVGSVASFFSIYLPEAAGGNFLYPISMFQN